MESESPSPTWWAALTDEDRAFVRRFVLASGSLKALAAGYGVSYPTVRLRLDRLIAKIEAVEHAAPKSDFERALLGAFADGALDAETMRRLRAAHEATLAQAGGTR